ncbi:MAG: exonuclease SbcCD subunit D [Lachnospiraceae bacterium]|nr:exonuclease SbcCD subunit D [Lachnospiraceae bacterium]
MKIMHLADLHIGKSVKDFSMIEDQRFILDWILVLAEMEKVDAVLIAGDVYDRSIPSEEAVGLFDEFIYRLTQIPVKVLLISGNHDSDERLNFGSRLFVDKEVYFCSKYDGELYRQTFEDEFGPVNFYLLPFVKASQVRHFHPEDEIENYDQAVRVAIADGDVNPDERNVILAHQFVAGRSGEVMLGGSESPAVANVGLVERIGFDCFDDFDYAALGHIHKAQSVGREEVRYAGTPLKYHADEAGDNKSIPIVTLGKKGEVKIELKQLKPRRDLRCLKGTLKQLLDPKVVNGTDDYIFVTLTEEDIIPDAMGIFRQTYPNTMQIRYENSHTREIEAVDPSQMAELRSFPELMTDFYQKMYGTDMTEEEMAIMNQVAKKAGVIDETN